MTKRIIIIFLLLSNIFHAQSQYKHWTAADGLPTGEVRQIIELPNRQMLVNCEGAFCLSDGKGFRALTCNHNRTLRIPHFTNGYAHLWEGDSLLWIRDYYRLYLFDTRIRSFRYDILSRLQDKSSTIFNNGKTINDEQTVQIEKLKTLDLNIQLSCTATDKDSGIWLGTRSDGIYYIPNHPYSASKIIANETLLRQCLQTVDSNGRIWHCQQDGLLCDDHGQLTLYNSTNTDGLSAGQMNFISELPNHTFLICHNLHEIGYFNPEQHQFISLYDKLPALSKHRYFVGSCVINDEWTAVYTQNGALLLNIQKDSIAPFPHAEIIENFSDKYNCMLKDRDSRIWIGTQNGLFCLTPSNSHNITIKSYSCEQIEGLSNNCIRSLVMDKSGNVWAGTSCGISRITPTVTNLSPDDGIPLISMRDRAAILSPDNDLLFAYGKDIVRFNPDSLINQTQTYPVVLISITVNDIAIPLDEISSDGLSFPYNKNNLVFEYSTLNYINPSHTRYRYRLKGLESTWHYSSPMSKDLIRAEYHALNYGSYTFEIQSATDKGIWGESSCTSITISPPIWLTWWAKSLYLLLFLSLLAYLVHLYFMRRKLKMEKENDERVNRLFELREEARHHFAESANIDPQTISINSEEEDLAKRMLQAIEAHMSDADYGVDQLASDVFLSRSSLYAKLRNMLGITPSDFIRNVRLKHAAQLLIDTQLPINEIAELVGYNTHKAFSSNFKKLFNILPSEYRSPK